MWQGIHLDGLQLDGHSVKPTQHHCPKYTLLDESTRKCGTETRCLEVVESQEHPHFCVQLGTGRIALLVLEMEVHSLTDRYELTNPAGLELFQSKG